MRTIIKGDREICRIGGYPELSDDFRKWIIGKVRSLVKYPDKAGVSRLEEEFDLELVITCERLDESAFTYAVLAELEAETKKRTGVIRPIIYVEGYRPRHLDY